MVRETPRAQIQIEAFVKVTNLFGLNTVLVHLFDYRAASRRVIPPAGPVG